DVEAAPAALALRDRASVTTSGPSFGGALSFAEGAASGTTFTDLVGYGLTRRSALLSNGMPGESIGHARFPSRNATSGNSVARSGAGSGRPTAAALAGGRVPRS